MEPPEVVAGDGSVGVRLHGELTLQTAPALTTALGELAAEHTASELVIDLREVTYLDSTCLSAMLEARRVQERHGGKLALLVAPGGPVADLFRISGTRDLLGVREDAEGPLESLV
jgi:anti-sigma B factor antagonist